MPILTPRAARSPASRGHQRGGAGVVDAPREYQAQRLRGDPRLDGRFENAAGLLPEDEARPRPDMPAALPPFEHEPPRIRRAGTVRASPVRGRASRSRSRRVPARPPGRAGPRRSRRTAAGPLRPRQAAPRASRPGRIRASPRPRDAPPTWRAVCSSRRSTSGRRSNAKRDEGQPSFPGNGLGERGHVAHPCHRALEDRQPTAVGPGKRRVLGQRDVLSKPSRSPRSTARNTAWTMPPTETYFLERSAASAASCPTGHACPGPQPTSASIARAQASPPCLAASRRRVRTGDIGGA